MLLSFLMITLADTALHAQVGSNILLKMQRKHHNIFKHNTEHKEFTLINKHNKKRVFVLGLEKCYWCIPNFNWTFFFICPPYTAHMTQNFQLSKSTWDTWATVGATLHKFWTTFKCAATPLKATSSSVHQAPEHTSPDLSKQHSYWTKNNHVISQKEMKGGNTSIRKKALKYINNLQIHWLDQKYKCF